MYCQLQHGGSVKDCECRRPGAGGWLPCPEVPMRLRKSLSETGLTTGPIGASGMAPAPAYSGDCCQICGNFAMVFTGTCSTCQVCGETTGCS